jgi:hypothetical protein
VVVLFLVLNCDSKVMILWFQLLYKQLWIMCLGVKEGRCDFTSLYPPAGGVGGQLKIEINPLSFENYSEINAVINVRHP